MLILIPIIALDIVKTIAEFINTLFTTFIKFIIIKFTYLASMGTPLITEPSPATRIAILPFSPINSFIF